MADYPKQMAKAPGHTKVAHNRREEVRLKWNGYREVTPDVSDAGEVKPTEEELTANEAEKAADPEAYLEAQRWETNGGAQALPRPKRKPAQN